MKKFIIVFVTFLLIVGFIRCSLGIYESTGHFVPTYDELIADFSKMPDVPQMFANDFTSINDAFNTLTNGFTEIKDPITFFIAIGNFINLGWRIIVAIVDTILIPVQWLMWCFGTLFGLNGSVQAI